MATNPLNIECGDLVKDNVTGFSGIVTQIVTYLNGCDRCAVQPQKLTGGKIIDPAFFDVLQLSIVKKQVVPRTNKNEVKNTGGYHEPPMGRTNPALR